MCPSTKLTCSTRVSPPVGRRQHLHDQKDIGIIVVELGSLIRIGDVLQEQGVEVELLPKGFEDVDLMYAADIDPCDSFISRRLELVQNRDNALVAPRAGVVEQSDFDSLRPLLTDVDQRAGRQSRLLRSFLDQFHSHLLVRRFRYEVKSVTIPPSFSSTSSLVTLPI